ncbi:MAG: hypothetical protein ACOYMB_04235 [Patescibacteria group bacterium]
MSGIAISNFGLTSSPISSENEVLYSSNFSSQTSLFSAKEQERMRGSLPRPLTISLKN